MLHPNEGMATIVDQIDYACREIEIMCFPDSSLADFMSVSADEAAASSCFSTRLQSLGSDKRGGKGLEVLLAAEGKIDE